MNNKLYIQVSYNQMREDKSRELEKLFIKIAPNRRRRLRCCVLSLVSIMTAMNQVLSPLSSLSNGPPSFPVTSYPKAKIKVLLLERISHSAIHAFVREGYHVETADSMSEEELIKNIPQYHVLGVRSKTQVTAAVLTAAKKLLTVGCYCIGVDQTDINAASLSGVCIFNAPFANTRSVAELVIGEMVILARQVADRSAECHRGLWNKQSSNCYELRGKTLCIIGYGHVGSQLSILAEAMGMIVRFYDIVPKLALGRAESFETLQTAITGAHFVSLHVPATPQTNHLIGETELGWFEKGAYLINAARGNVVDLDALTAALKAKKLNGAAIDVYPDEPADKSVPFECPLRGLPNVILTPHIGGSTEEAQVAIGTEVAGKQIAYINTGTTIGAVNFPELQLPHTHTHEVKDVNTGKTMTTTVHRILNVHKNIPGVLRDVNSVLSEYNVVAQMLMTLGAVGYLIVDVDKEVSAEIKVKIAQLKSSIKTRILY